MNRCIALLAALALPLAAPAADDKPTIESLFKQPQYASMRMSPDGQYLAALAPVGPRQNLVVMDIAKRSAIPITGLTKKDVVSVQWINNKRLMFRTGTLGERVFDARGGALIAIDRDGSQMRIISEGDDDERNTSGWRVTFRALQPVRSLPGDTDDIIVQEHVFSQRTYAPGPLYRLDTRRGRKTTISDGKPEAANSENWVVDRNGVARAFTVQVENTARIWYRDGADAPWRKLDEFDPLSAGRWGPLAMADDGKRLIVSTHRDGRDKAALALYDPATKSFVETLASHPQVNLDRLAGDKDGVRGVSYDADRQGSAWFDADIAAVQSAMDKSFPDAVNALSWSLDKKKFIVASYSDVSPGTFYLYDRGTGKVEWLADRMPWIDAKKMAPMQPVR
jgi:dipeptidyl aminopeptidase/acylaminoacyl peptidase